jgi:Ca-activated chloride channel family protein
MFELSYPIVFLLLPLPLILARLLPVYLANRPAIRTPFFDDLSQIIDEKSISTQGKIVSSRAHRLLAVCCWILLLFALARPQYIEDPLTQVISTRDLLLAVDLSTSMSTEDFTNTEGQTVDRLSAVKEVLNGFLEKRQGDRVGLILFGMAPFVQVPFTEDLKVCRVLLDEAQVGMAGPQTMIGDAIGLAITIFEESEVESRQMILLTDGNDTGSRIPPEEAAKIAAEKGIVIHSIAVGDPLAAGEAKLDEESLEVISKLTNGQYFKANDREELEIIYKTLDELDAREVQSISFRPKRDLFFWPLSAMIILSFLFHFRAGAQAQRNMRRRKL